MSSEVETSLTVHRRLDNNNERFLDFARNDRAFQTKPASFQLAFTFSSQAGSLRHFTCHDGSIPSLTNTNRQPVSDRADHSRETWARSLRCFSFARFSILHLGKSDFHHRPPDVDVAVEWEIYARTHSATALGLVGLMIALPVGTLSRSGRPHRRSIRRETDRARDAGVERDTALPRLAYRFVAAPRDPGWPILHTGNHFLTGIASIFERHNRLFPFR